jgi:hypothetical protein
MIPMTTKIAVMLLCSLMLAPVQALAKSKSAAILPDGCGDDAVMYDAIWEKDNPGLPALADGKALIVFVESLPYSPKKAYKADTIRFGVDGAWVGANIDESYFTVTVDPGEHNLCASAEYAPNSRKHLYNKTATFTAEPGKVYYFEAAHNVIGGQNASISAFDFAQLSESDGKYRVKAWKFATSNPKK